MVISRIISRFRKNDPFVMEGGNMSSKVAILVDGGYLVKRWNFIHKKQPTAANVLEHCNKLIQKMNERSGDRSNELFRIYYYDCMPFRETVHNPITDETTDYSTTQTAIQRESFLDELSKKPRVAFRKGELVQQGWTIQKDIPALRNIYRKLTRHATITEQDIRDFKEAFTINLIQKRTDIMVGLDIAWLSSRRQVDKIILVTGDTDFIPAMKLARREGILMIVNPLKNTLNENFFIHSDDVIDF